VITLVLGGARSGKSLLAETLAARHPTPVTYVASMVPGDDEELAARVEAHRTRRQAGWATVEVGAGDDLAELLTTLAGTALVDSLGPWVASRPSATASDDADRLAKALLRRNGDTVVVSDEVGLAVHPSSEAGRHFRDALGSLNHAVSAVADHAYLVVAGRALTLPSPGAPS
jgi:adenosyl cobinamide kinase/adenosyl cobinamide phosphate guanylyltransferase